MNVQKRVHGRKKKQNILQYEIQKKSHNTNTLGGKKKTIFFFYLRYLYKNLIVLRGLSYLW